MKRISLLFLLFTVVLFGACAKEEVLDGERPAEKIPTNTLRLSLHVKGIGTEIDTRGPVAIEPGEDQISSLYLLFFVPDPYQAGLFVDYVKVEGPLTMNTEIDIDLSSHSLLNISASYDILAIANVGEGYLDENIADWMSRWQGKRENQVMSEAFAQVKGAVDDRYAIAPEALLMNGRVMKAPEQYNLRFILTRNVVRFDVQNNQRESYDLVSASIWNAYPVSSIWDNGVLDYTSNALRIHRYYGVDNSSNETEAGQDGKGNMLANIVGGLYAFENRVANPTENDQYTTCLIIGLRERASGMVTYYRANIHPGQSAQSLRRNNVYRLIITQVGGPGVATEQLAYAGRNTNLNYIINAWEQDDNGLIVQDGNSILSLPAKIVRIGRSGGEMSFSVFTYSKSDAGSSLNIKSQTWEPSDGHVVSSLNGNTLVMRAAPLSTEETERHGVVVLSFAGLEASVTVIQSEATERFLNVHLPEGGVSRFPSFAGIGSERIRVEASGPWTAKLYMNGFSFSPAVSPSAAVMSIRHTDGYVSDNKFRIYTHTPNPDLVLREAFVMVSLDADPDHYVSVIRIAQRASGSVTLSPEQIEVTFNGRGDDLVAMPGNATAMFNVLPSLEDNDQISDWSYAILPSGATDDTGLFTVADVQKSATIMSDNRIMAGAVGMNTSGRSYRAVLRISLTNDPSKFSDINLVQQSAVIDLLPDMFSAIPVVGGHTPLIAVQVDNSLQWSATITMNSGTAPDGRSLVNHMATLVDEDGNPLETGTLYPVSKRFRIVFPKMYYPNREINPISATLIIRVEGMTKIVTITQEGLVPANFYATGIRNGFGGLHGSYNAAYLTALKNIPGYTLLRLDTNSAVPAGTTYLHVSSQNIGSSFNWTHANTFRQQNDGLTFIAGDSNAAADLAGVNNTNSPLGVAGYTIVNSNGLSAILNTSVSQRRIYRFLTDKGHTPLSGPGNGNNGTVATFSVDAVSTQATVYPPSAVPVIVHSGTSRAFLVIDPTNRLIYIGESQMFDTSITGNRNTFLDNLMYYIANAVKYGSHFTDLLRDDLDLSAPWDAAWGANAGVPTK